MASKPKPTRAPGKASSHSDTKLVKELAAILNDTGLTEIEMRKGDLRIRVSKGSNIVQTMSAAPALAAPAASQPAAAPAAQAEAQDAADHQGAVKSPMVGTAYVRPSPDADTFVNIGDKVKEGDTVMLIEAMKTFNPITAPKSGKIEDMLVQDGQPVEFGEALFIIT